MGNAREYFEHALLVEHVAKRAKEFTPEGWKAYKQEHPGAKPADHKITKTKPEAKKPEAKPEKSSWKERDKADDEKYWAEAKPKMEKLLKDHGYDPADVESISEQNPEWLKHQLREKRETGAAPGLDSYKLKKKKQKK